MSIRFKMLRMLSWLTVLLAATSPVRADLTIGGSSGLQIRNGATVNVNCGDVTVGSGGALDLGNGGIDNCRHFTLESGAIFIDDAGSLSLNGTWMNNSDFGLSGDSTIGFTSVCGIDNGSAGSGDTDGDGLTDDTEGALGTNPLDSDSDDDGLTDGMEDANHNGVVEDGETDPLTADAGPGIPVLVAPADTETEVRLTARLQVDYEATADESLHAATRWQIAGDADFNDLVLDGTSAASLLDMTVPDMVLEPGVTHYWRACFHGLDGRARMWSQVRAFTTTTKAAFTDADANGIADDQEVDPAIQLDMDADGQNDTQQSDMMCVNFPDGEGIFCLKMITNVDAIEMLACVDPAEIDQTHNRPYHMDLGLYGFRLDVSDPVAETVVRAYFSRSVESWKGWVKHDSIHGWQDYSGYATYHEGRQVATLELVDGGFGDADGTANGVIIDPSGPGIPANSGGGGCFIQTAGDCPRNFFNLLFD